MVERIAPWSAAVIGCKMRIPVEFFINSTSNEEIINGDKLNQSIKLYIVAVTHLSAHIIQALRHALWIIFSSLPKVKTTQDTCGCTIKVIRVLAYICEFKVLT